MRFIQKLISKCESIYSKLISNRIIEEKEKMKKKNENNEEK